MVTDGDGGDDDNGADADGEYDHPDDGVHLWHADLLLLHRTLLLQEAKKGTVRARSTAATSGNFGAKPATNSPLSSSAATASTDSRCEPT